MGLEICTLVMAMRLLWRTSLRWAVDGQLDELHTHRKPLPLGMLFPHHLLREAVHPTRLLDILALLPSLDPIVYQRLIS